jgi:nicotinamidase/pyrazinamidase
MKNALVLIDYQNDFSHVDGSLYVPGAAEDVERICKFIKDKGEEIDKIFVSLDSHQKIDIAHPGFWVDENGNHPEPFTTLTHKDVADGIWFKNGPGGKVAEKYLQQLEQKGKSHTLWPEHCLIGTWGWELNSKLKEALDDWGGEVEYVIKGVNPFTEHYGIFESEVQNFQAPSTQRDLDLLIRLSTYNRVYVSGEAKSHCVAASVKQMIDYNRFGEGQIVILADTMSPVPGFETIADPIYKEAKEKGFVFMNTNM